MGKSVLFVIVILTLIFTKNAAAFEFDIWSSGMTVSGVMAKAEKYDVPLHRNGLISGNKHFNPEISRKYADSADDFYYKTELLGKWATVTMHFTPSGRKLSIMTITWGNITAKSNFSEEVAAMLTDKYGKSEEITRDIFFRYQQWDINANNMVIMRMSPDDLELKYVDKPLDDLGHKEVETRQEQEKEKSFGKDQKKF